MSWLLMGSAAGGMLAGIIVGMVYPEPNPGMTVLLAIPLGALGSILGKIADHLERGFGGS